MSISQSQFLNRLSMEEDIPKECSSFFNVNQEYGYNQSYSNPFEDGMGSNMNLNLNQNPNIYDSYPQKQPESGSHKPSGLSITATKTMLPLSTNVYNEENNANAIGGQESEYFKSSAPILGRQQTFHHYDETNNHNIADRTEMSKDLGYKDYASMNDFTVSKTTYEAGQFHTDSSVVKRRPGKDPYSQPKDVARHFLKVHMKKCLAYAGNNMDVARMIIESKMRRNEEEKPFKFPKNYLDILQKHFNSWLSGLKKDIKDYGKEDFKKAFYNDRKAFRNMMYDLVDDKKMEGLLIKKPEVFNEWIFKETLQEISLMFVNDEGPGGLKSQLVASANILEKSGEEHFKLLRITRWLLEKPERIETAEVFGKRWVASFLQNRMDLEPTA